MAWEGSTRWETLPPNWPALCKLTRKAAATADHPRGQCQRWYASAVDGRWMRCTRAGDEVDHCGDRLDHSQRELLCAHHHRIKTSREAREAKDAVRARGKRPVEAHPGRRGR